MENLTNEEVALLLKMEKGATYSVLRNPLSMEPMITADKGRNFSTILSHEDMFVPSCNAINIPQVDAMLVWGESLSITRYAAEAALRHREKYGVYPAFLTCGGVFNSGWLQGKTKAKCYEDIMQELGFDHDWVMQYHSTERINVTDTLNAAVAHVPHRGKLMVLAITAAGHSLLAAQTIVPIFPQIKFCFFETPSIKPEQRCLDSDILGPEGYAADMIIGNIIRARMMKYPEGLRLLVESRLALAGKSDLLYFINKGYAMNCNDIKIWKYFNIKPARGAKLSAQRYVDLYTKERDPRIELQKIRTMIDDIKHDLSDLGLMQ